MSLAAVTARVDEIQQLLSRPMGAPAPSAADAAPARTPAAQPTGFAAQVQSALASASTMGATAPVAAPGATPAGAAGATPYDGLIQDAAARHGLDPALLKGLIRQESGFDPNAGSPAGARGLAQLMPGTAAALGVTDVLDPAQSVEGGARYLADQLRAFGGDPSLALAAYNAGPGAVQRHGGIPPYAETRDYVQKVLSFAEAYR